MRPETAVELSQLVSLLEAPAFAPLRLQLLQPGQHPALLRAMHGVLMLLPQVGGSEEAKDRLLRVQWLAQQAHCRLARRALVSNNPWSWPRSAGRRLPHAADTAAEHTPHGPAVTARGARRARRHDHCGGSRRGRGAAGRHCHQPTRACGACPWRQHCQPRRRQRAAAVTDLPAARVRAAAVDRGAPPAAALQVACHGSAACVDGTCSPDWC